jgi:nitrate reductase delta subunit
VTHWGVLSFVLQYPDTELVAAQDELERAAVGSAPISRFLAWQRDVPLRALQESYVRTFDFDRRASLHLTYHTHGDRRERGIRLVALKRRYAEAGLPLTDNELPDYLPVVLEFAALAPGEGVAILNELRAPLELVRSRLHQVESPYAELLDATVDDLPKPTKAQVDAALRLADEGPPTELVGLEPFTPGAPR